MNRRLFWGAVAAVGAAAIAVAMPLMAQNRQGGQQQESLDDHRAQEQRDQQEADARAKRREAARAGQDPRNKQQGEIEEEERPARRDPR